MKGLAHLLYPDYCIGCNTEIIYSHRSFCIKCLSNISNSDHFEVKDNDLVFRLSGRIDLLHGAALFNFIKGGSVQNAVHTLKYLNRRDIGIAFGNNYGEKFLASEHFSTPDLIIPIPLHYKREQKRGYNQSEKFAQGISEIITVPVSKKHLIKVEEIDSQTSMSREDRFVNVLNSFKLRNKAELTGKTILLVDDVLTTGATIEAACVLLAQAPDIKIQLGLIALADG